MPRPRRAAAATSARSVLPTTSTRRRFSVRSSSHSHTPIETKTPNAAPISAVSGSSRPGRCPFRAVTQTSPVPVPISDGTHGPSTYGVLANAARRLASHTTAASERAASPAVSTGLTAAATIASESQTTT